MRKTHLQGGERSACRGCSALTAAIVTNSMRSKAMRCACIVIHNNWYVSFSYCVCALSKSILQHTQTVEHDVEPGDERDGGTQRHIVLRRSRSGDDMTSQSRAQSMLGACSLASATDSVIFFCAERLSSQPPTPAQTPSLGADDIAATRAGLSEQGRQRTYSDTAAQRRRACPLHIGYDNETLACRLRIRVFAQLLRRSCRVLTHHVKIPENVLVRSLLTIRARVSAAEVRGDSVRGIH